jgi:hypothetical protein
MKETFRFWRHCMLFSLLSLGFMYTPLITKAQTKSVITGKVVDDSGKPLEGATIEEKGTTNRTATRSDGSFSMSVAANKTLVITSVGFAQQEVAIANRATLSITLEKSSKRS